MCIHPSLLDIVPAWCHPCSVSGAQCSHIRACSVVSILHVKFTMFMSTSPFVCPTLREVCDDCVLCVQATVPLLALSCWSLCSLPHPSQMILVAIYCCTQGSCSRRNSSFVFNTGIFGPNPVLSHPVYVCLSHVEMYNASR